MHTNPQQPLRDQLEPIRHNEVARFLKKEGIQENSLLEKATHSFLDKIISAITEGDHTPSTFAVADTQAVLKLFSRPA